MSYNFRRSRGYTFEQKEMVGFFDSRDNWHARRLGGTSTGMPDVLITNNKDSILWSVECKSMTAKDVNDPNNQKGYIPQDQIQRCYSMLDMFSVYIQKNVVFAFKFATKKPRKHHYFFFKIHGMTNIKSLICTTDGEVRTTKQSKDIPCAIAYAKYKTFEKLMKDEPEPFTPTLC
jgi:hypothetical protein